MQMCLHCSMRVGFCNPFAAIRILTLLLKGQEGQDGQAAAMDTAAPLDSHHCRPDATARLLLLLPLLANLASQHPPTAALEGVDGPPGPHTFIANELHIETELGRAHLPDKLQILHTCSICRAGPRSYL
jgi:hypothetical protein